MNLKLSIIECCACHLRIEAVLLKITADSRSLLLKAPKCGNGVFTLTSSSNVSRPLCAGEICRRNNLRSFWICVWKKSHDCRDVIVFAKLRFQNVFGSHENAKPAFHILFDLNGAFETLRFRDRLVWTVRLTWYVLSLILMHRVHQRVSCFPCFPCFTFWLADSGRVFIDSLYARQRTCSLYYISLKES